MRFFRELWGNRSKDDAGPSTPAQIATESTDPTENSTTTLFCVFFSLVAVLLS